MAARRGSEPVVLKSPLLRLMLVLAPMASCGVFAAVPSEGWHPLAALASLLPLQLAALLWALSRMPTAAAARPPAGLKPPATAGWPPAGGSAGG